MSTSATEGEVNHEDGSVQHPIASDDLLVSTTYMDFDPSTLEGFSPDKKPT